MPWTFEALAAAVQKLGTPVSAIYYRQIYNGREPGVHAQLLANTAEALGLPTNFFTDAVVRTATMESLATPSEANAKLMKLVTEFRELTHAQQQRVLDLLSESSS
ncbi:MAG: hypothetical protein M3Y49_12810 [Actinomycetota bacterium]|nr:hypothetical protein [Actinomycetota bacterium]